jgi:hypothetical protein
MSCRWSFYVPDGLNDDDPVSLYVFSRTVGTTSNPSVVVRYRGAYSIDPNINII